MAELNTHVNVKEKVRSCCVLTLGNCKLGNLIPAGKNLIIVEEGKNGLQRYIESLSH